jgi:monoterpene epsilon-lactone hydrolase
MGNSNDSFAQGDAMPSLQSYLIEGYLRLMKRLAPPVSGEWDIEKERADTEAMAKQFGRFSGVECTPVSANGVPAEWIVPTGCTTRRCILYLHGGTFITGSIDSHRSLAANIAVAAQARALLIDYRLAPEHPFPAGPQDVMTAYMWLLKNGTAAQDIVIAGDSAGGTLTLGLLFSLRDEGKPLPAAAVCLSPAIDLSFSGETWQTNAKADVMLDREKEKIGIGYYLQGKDPHTPMASPLFNTNFSGLPPILIQVGSKETLLSDATSFTEKAKAAGGDITLEVWDGMQHEWQFAVGMLPEARRAIKRIGEFSAERFSSV